MGKMKLHLHTAVSHAEVVTNFDVIASEYTSSSALFSSSLSSPASSSSSSAAALTSATSMSFSVPAPSVPAALTADTIQASASTSAFVEPYLEGFATTNITTQIGTHAYLPCRVKQLGNKSVSWVRVRDGHILTVDR
uniref:Ig-like domain-containing protein n=1 Tax=Glossina brevipalpis TaxID=37001 RepID=A0A1A9WM75_9MUSC